MKRQATEYHIYSDDDVYVGRIERTRGGNWTCYRADAVQIGGWYRTAKRATERIEHDWLGAAKAVSASIGGGAS